VRGSRRRATGVDLVFPEHIGRNRRFPRAITEEGEEGKRKSVLRDRRDDWVKIGALSSEKLYQEPCAINVLPGRSETGQRTTNFADLGDTVVLHATLLVVEGNQKQMWNGSLEYDTRRWATIICQNIMRGTNSVAPIFCHVSRKFLSWVS
jgi:hypothetical protein